jgi:hypothetical protein
VLELMSIESRYHEPHEKFGFLARFRNWHGDPSQETYEAVNLYVGTLDLLSYRRFCRAVLLGTGQSFLYDPAELATRRDADAMWRRFVARQLDTSTRGTGLAIKKMVRDQLLN